jgi:hypothetical protein
LRALILIFSLLAAQSALAKLFTPGKESFGAYLKGTGGVEFENTLLSESRGAGADVFDSNHAYNFSGEFGFSWSSQHVVTRAGLEIIRPSTIKDRDANNSVGALYNVTSEISILVPKLDFEINLKRWSASKLYLLVGVGYASMVARNSYSMISLGTVAYPGVTDFSEDLRSTATLYEGALGFEGVMSDSNTYFVEAGYRGLTFEDVTHNQGATTFQGAVSQGDPAKNRDGTARSLDLSNGYAAIGLRFWIR